MKDKSLLRGMATVSFFADDMEAARTWYSDLLGVEPYFQRPDAAHPAYIEFRIGDYQAELGIIDRKLAPKGLGREPGGAVLFWHVDDVEKTLARLTELGAKELEPITKREAGFVTASVIDPFGNVIGVMYNPHYLSIVKATEPRIPPHDRRPTETRQH
jgi:predicted enzyme related to lactoylglutathione lyase